MESLSYESGRDTSHWCTETRNPLKTVSGLADMCGSKDRSCSVEGSNRSQYKDNDEASGEAGTSSEASTQDNYDEIASASCVSNKISSKCTDNGDNNDEIASGPRLCAIKSHLSALTFWMTILVVKDQPPITRNSSQLPDQLMN